MSLGNPLDVRIEAVIAGELAANRDVDLTVDDDRAEIARRIRIRLQRSGVLADVKRTPDALPRASMAKDKRI